MTASRAEFPVWRSAPEATTRPAVRAARDTTATSESSACISLDIGLVDADGQRRGLPPVRGRAAELAVIDDAIRGAADGGGGVVIIDGPPGIGKSRLLAEVAERAQSRGVRTLFGRGFEYQQSAPFYPLFMATLHANPPVGDAEALRGLRESADLRYWVVHDLSLIHI